MRKITKDSIRKKFRKKRLQLSYTQRDMSSSIIIDKIKELIITKQSCKKVFLYHEFDSEVIVSRAIPFVQRRSIEVYVPIFENGQWKIAKINEQTKWSVDKNGNSFPQNPQKIFITLGQAQFKKDDIVIIPGIAFSIYGERIGYGKGNYDRFLQNTSALKVGVCFDFQISQKLPTEDHDIKMDMILTDTIDFKFI